MPTPITAPNATIGPPSASRTPMIAALAPRNKPTSAAVSLRSELRRFWICSAEGNCKTDTSQEQRRERDQDADNIRLWPINELYRVIAWRHDDRRERSIGPQQSGGL